MYEILYTQYHSKEDNVNLFLYDQIQINKIPV
jgi:hypothetical protein